MEKMNFNVAEIAHYGNGGGGRVVLLPVRRLSNESNLDDSSRIELFFKDMPSDIKLGEYIMELSRIL